MSSGSVDPSTLQIISTQEITNVRIDAEKAAFIKNLVVCLIRVSSATPLWRFYPLVVNGSQA